MVLTAGCWPKSWVLDVTSGEVEIGMTLSDTPSSRLCGCWSLAPCPLIESTLPPGWRDRRDSSSSPHAAGTWPAPGDRTPKLLAGSRAPLEEGAFWGQNVVLWSTSASSPPESPRQRPEPGDGHTLGKTSPLSGISPASQGSPCLQTRLCLQSPEQTGSPEACAPITPPSPPHREMQAMRSLQARHFKTYVLMIRIHVIFTPKLSSRKQDPVLTSLLPDWKRSPNNNPTTPLATHTSSPLAATRRGRASASVWQRKKLLGHGSPEVTLSGSHQHRTEPVVSAGVCLLTKLCYMLRRGGGGSGRSWALSHWWEGQSHTPRGCRAVRDGANGTRPPSAPCVGRAETPAAGAPGEGRRSGSQARGPAAGPTAPTAPPLQDGNFREDANQQTRELVCLFKRLFSKVPWWPISRSFLEQLSHLQTRRLTCNCAR